MDKEVKEMLKNHEERITNLEAIAEENKKTFARMDKTFARIDKTLDEHSKTLEEHTKILNSLQRSMVIVEDAVLNKIPALFDGYTMHQEKQEQLEKRVDQLEQVSQMHSTRLIVLESNSNQTKTKLSS